MKSEIESLIEQAWASHNTNPNEGSQQLALAEALLRNATIDVCFIKQFAQWQWAQGSSYLAQAGVGNGKTHIELSILKVLSSV